MTELKRVVVIGGAGAMGQVIVKDLLENEQIEVVIADYDRDKADQFAESLHSERVRGDFTDITNRPIMVKILTKADCVINSTPYYHNVNVMEAALEAGTNYIDLGGLFHVTKEQLKLHERFKEKNLTAIVGMGAAPGMTNIMAEAGQKDLDTVESIDILVGSVDNVKVDHPFMPPYSIETLIDEYTLNPMVFEDGDYKAEAPLSGALMVDFPQPVGKQEAIYTLHSEVLTIPMTYKDKGIKRVTFRLGLPLEFHEKIKFLMALGFGEKKQIATKEGDFTPRKLLAEMIGKFPVPQNEPDDCEVIRVDVKGSKGGKPILVRMETIVVSDKKWKVSCGALDTGVPPSIAAQMIIAGQVEKKGVLAPEVALDPDKFFAELEKRNITIKRLEPQLAGLQ
ncbi:saccharopine dehydrogenase C-terminal domain-containing protein [soil metagenome]